MAAGSFKTIVAVSCLTIDEPGFETPTIAEGSFSTFDSTAWDVESNIFLRNPTLQNVTQGVFAVSSLNSAVYQTLGDTFGAFRTYELTIDVLSLSDVDYNADSGFFVSIGDETTPLFASDIFYTLDDFTLDVVQQVSVSVAVAPTDSVVGNNIRVGVDFFGTGNSPIIDNFELCITERTSTSTSRA